MGLEGDALAGVAGEDEHVKLYSTELAKINKWLNAESCG